MQKILIFSMLLLTMGCTGGGGGGLTPGASVEPETPSPTPETPTPTQSCPTNYVKIAANSTYSTSAFCLAKYEMKVANNDGTPVFDGFNGGVALDVSLYKPESRPHGIPWVKILQADAVAECASLGTGYHLATAKEWQVAAREIEGINANWSGGTPGNGGLFSGHTDSAVSATAIADGHAVTGSTLLSAGDGTDPYVGTGQNATLSFGSGKEQKRTFVLLSGEEIWDMSGNARDFVDIDGSGGSLSYTGPGSEAFYDLGSAAFSSMMATNGLPSSAGFRCVAPLQ